MKFKDNVKPKIKGIKIIINEDQARKLIDRLILESNLKSRKSGHK